MSDEPSGRLDPAAWEVRGRYWNRPHQPIQAVVPERDRALDHRSREPGWWVSYGRSPRLGHWLKQVPWVGLARGLGVAWGVSPVFADDSFCKSNQPVSSVGALVAVEVSPDPPWSCPHRSCHPSKSDRSMSKHSRNRMKKNRCR